MSFPILEHDPTREALIEPSMINQPRDVPVHCIICFFNEVIEKITTEYHAKIIADSRWEDGAHHLYELTYKDQRIAFFHPGVGAPLAAGLFEDVIAYGCKKFIACGGCGVLEKGIHVGNLIVVSGAIRDEGVSYHYIAPDREIAAQVSVVNTLSDSLSNRGILHRVGKTWTTDAPFRETKNKISARKAEGCLTVEMEAAALLAVSQFRQVKFGQILYGGDDLSGVEWDNRDWQSRTQIREELFWLCADACLSL